jgi:hypothetical protein
MPTYRVIVAHPLTRRLLARLNVDKPRWTEAVNGTTSFDGTVTLPEDPQAVRILKDALIADAAAIYVQDTNTGKMSFGGVLKRVAWQRNARRLTIVAVGWRGWLYGVFLGPKTDMTGDTLYSFTNVDQLEIARQILYRVLAGGAAAGRPIIDTQTYPLSGQLRDLHLRGMDFVTAGEALDRISTRDNGFEWDIIPREGEDGLPSLDFWTYYPQRGGPVPGLRFSDDKNIVEAEDYEQDTSDKRTRVWAVGEGNPNATTPYVQDTDPSLPRGETLLTESKTQYNSIVNLSTLSSHARAERVFRNAPMELYTFTVNMDDPPVTSYEVGDRGDLRIRDEWVNETYRNARIIQREMMPGEGAGKVKITMDLNDAVLPQEA